MACWASPLKNRGSLAVCVVLTPTEKWYRALPEALYGQVGSAANKRMMKTISRMATMIRSRFKPDDLANAEKWRQFRTSAWSTQLMQSGVAQFQHPD